MSVAARFEANASEDHSSPFYFNPSHWRAMDGVVEGVKAREGIMIMTGPTGSGKTMLMRAISDNLGEGVTPLFLQYASLNFREFVNYLHNALKVDDEVMDASNKAVALRKFLYLQAERNETAVLFIDEAQNLEPDVLRMLPKLACFDQLEDGTNVGLQFMLTGGADLRELLDDHDFKEVRESVARDYELRFFSREELKYFLDKRLAPLARLTPEPITDDAINAIGKYTGGSPRLIGMICSHAMLFAAENPGRSIDEAMIDEAAEALMIESTDHPFPDEEEASELSGPFSSADLRGDDRKKAPQAVAGTPSEEQDEEMETTSDFNSPIAPSVDESYDDDPIKDSAFDAAEMDAIINEFDTDADPYADDLDDIAVDEDEFSPSFGGVKAGGVKAGVAAGAAGAMAVAASKGGSVFASVKSAVSGGIAKRNSKKQQVVEAGRNSRKADRAAPPAEKRAMKTRVAGQRKKQLKVAGIAAAFCALAFGAYMISSEVSKVVAKASDSISDTASRAMDTVTTTGSRAVEGISAVADNTFGDKPSFGSSTNVAALDIDAPALTTTNVMPDQVAPTPAAPVVAEPAKKGGWGARVQVVNADGSLKMPAKLPEGGVSIARGALDLIDTALDKGKAVLPDTMGAAIDVAKGDIQGLRSAAAANGATGDDRDARILELVEKGDAFFERKLFIAPARGNAYDAYRAALDIDPNNESALRGIENLRAFYTEKAEQARSKKQWDNANRFFETAIGISQRKSVR
jgi:general secretion pathway protein A